MQKKIQQLIEQYDTIIVQRHKNPDGDALGTQLGLKQLLTINYPDKEVYAVGDENSFSFLGDMDQIKDSVFQGALVIIVDVAVDYLVSDIRYQYADHVIIIDHHLNKSNIGDTEFIMPDYIACAELVCDLAQDYNWDMDSLAATRLLCGIVTDSGRFLYPSTKSHTLRMAGYLMEQGADLQFIYDNLYTETMNFKRLKGHFINNFKTTKNNVAYMKNDHEVKEMFNVSTFTISRAMVNQMAGIKGIDIWANFTLDEDNSVQCELRSKDIPIIDIARKYGGGGHRLACGCTVSSFEEADQVLHDLDRLIQERNTNGKREAS